MLLDAGIQNIINIAVSNEVRNDGKDTETQDKRQRVYGFV